MKETGRLDRFLQDFVAALLLFVVGLTFFQILGRLILHTYLPWGEEASRFVAIWITFIGAIYLMKTHEHLSVGIRVHSSLPPRIIAAIDAVLDLCIGSISLIAAYHSALFTWASMDYRASSLVWLRMGLVFLPVPVGMAGIACLAARDLYRHVGVMMLHTMPMNPNSSGKELG